MAIGRLLLKKISKNDALARVIAQLDHERPGSGAYAALLFTWSIAHLDCEGRIEGNPHLLRSEVFPFFDWINASDVERYLRALANESLVIWYEVGGRRWLEFPGFAASQPGLRKEREGRSMIPPPASGRVLFSSNADAAQPIAMEQPQIAPELLRSESGQLRSDSGQLRSESGEGEVEDQDQDQDQSQKKPQTRARARERFRGELDLLEPPRIFGNEPSPSAAARPPPAPSSVPLALEAPLDLGKPASAEQKRVVDRWLPSALEIFEELNRARGRVMRIAPRQRPTYASLAGIAGRLEAGKTREECRQVIASCEAQIAAGDAVGEKYFNAVTPFRPENFEIKLALAASGTAARAGPKAIHSERGQMPVVELDDFADAGEP